MPDERSSKRESQEESLGAAKVSEEKEAGGRAS
jgi:hypothetical protein